MSAKHILICLGIIASLFIGKVSACACSHHAEKKIVTSDCHSHHGDAQDAAETAESSSCDTVCVCAAGQPSPLAASQTPTKQLKVSDLALAAEPFSTGLETDIVAVASNAAPTFAYDLSYSSTLTSLLPSRAPPRL